MHCIVGIVFYALYSIHCILCIVFYELYYIHCILQGPHGHGWKFVSALVFGWNPNNFVSYETVHNFGTIELREKRKER